MQNSERKALAYHESCLGKFLVHAGNLMAVGTSRLALQGDENQC